MTAPPSTSADLPLYVQLMGTEFDRLPKTIQQLHRHLGKALYVGRVDVFGPETWLARTLALLLGTPQTFTRGPITFELDATPTAERWVRRFPTKVMTSTFSIRDGLIVEKLGAATLHFRLQGNDIGLKMQLVRMYFFGVPCPRLLIPLIVAEETQSNETFCFRIEAHAPFVGRVVSYTGHLKLAEESSR